MNRFIFATLLLLFIKGNAQDKPVIDADTLRYAGRSFAPGDTIRLKYGSKPDKSFAFVWYGNKLSWDPAVATQSKTEMVVEKHWTYFKKLYIVASAVGGKNLGQKYYIIAEGAIDNGEL